MKLRFVTHDEDGELVPLPPGAPMSTDDPIPGETSILTWIEIVAADDEISSASDRKTYRLTLRVLDRDGSCVGQESRELHPAENRGVLPAGVQDFRAEYFGEYTLEAAMGDARTASTFTIVDERAAR